MAAARSQSPINLSKQTKEDKVRFAEAIVDEAIRWRKNTGVIELYERGLRYYDGNHKIKMRDKSKGNSVWNKFAEICENRIAHLTDSLPKWIYYPQSDDDIFTSKMLNQVIGDVVYDYSEWEENGVKSVTHAFFAGTNHIKTLIDPNGYPRFIPVSIGAVAWDKEARSAKQLRYIVHFIVKSVADIYRDYNVKVAPMTNLDDTEGHMTPETAKLSYHASGDNTAPNVNWENIKDDKPENNLSQDLLGQAILAEIWLDNPEMENIPFKKTEVEEEHFNNEAGITLSVNPDENHGQHVKFHEIQITEYDAETQAQEIANLLKHIEEHRLYANEDGEFETKRPKYPKGQILTICQHKLLRDAPVGGPLHWRDRWIKWDYISFPDRYLGKPGTKDLFDPQDDLNHRKNSITMNINLLNNGIRKVRQGLYNFLQNKIKWDNWIGKVIPVNNMNDVEVDFGRPLPDSYFKDIIVTEQSMEKLAGHDDIKQGRLPKAGTAGITIEQLNEEGSKRMKMTIRNYAGALRKMAQNASIIIADPDVGLDDKELMEILGLDNRLQNINMDSIRDKMKLIKNIRIDTKSMMPTSRMESLNTAIMLKNAGVYDNQAVLNRIDDDQKYEVMQRMSEILQLQNIAQFQQEELDRKEKELNTLQNRMQSNKGEGNVGSQKTSE